MYSKNPNNNTLLAGNLSNKDNTTAYSASETPLLPLLISETRSSETIRNISYNFYFFRSGLSPKNLDDDWLIWFIGFCEGDAYIGNYNNILRFAITQKEGAILHHIKDT